MVRRPSVLSIASHCCGFAAIQCFSTGCTLGSAQFPMTNCLQQSAPLRTAATLQHNQCPATDISITSPHTIGLASAVWSAAAIQPVHSSSSGTAASVSSVTLTADVMNTEWTA